MRTTESVLPAPRTLNAAELRAEAVTYGATLLEALHTDTDKRRAADTYDPAATVLHLADLADTLDLIGKAFTSAAAEARALTEIDKDRAGILADSWLVPAPDGSAVVICPDTKRTVTWDESMLSTALAAAAYNALANELCSEFAPIPLDGEERERMRRAVTAGVSTALGQARHSWRITDLTRVRVALANADDATATLIDRAKTETVEMNEGVKVKRIPAKPPKA